MATKQQVTDSFLELLRSEAKTLRVSLKHSATEVANYAVARAQVLALAQNEPGFDRVLTAEAHNVALFAGISTATAADKVDQRIVAVIHGALAIAAAALVA